jgi:GNAT superfamily N-acetyltransferase
LRRNVTSGIVDGMQPPHLDILPIDPLDAPLVDEWIDMRHAVEAHDRPGEPRSVPALLRLDLLTRNDFFRTERYVARDAGAVVGAVELGLSLKENEHLVELWLHVHPGHRRLGVGGALLDFAERRAAELGRDTILCYAVDRLESGPAFDEAGRHFAKARGFAIVDRSIHRRNDIRATSDTAIGELYDRALEHAAGYELYQYAGYRVPDDDVVHGIAVLCERMYSDAPKGEDLDVHIAYFDNARIREYERARERKAQMQVVTAARHQATGVIAGYTFIAVNPGDEEHAWQDDTIVLPEHRGHRLGLILKIANQRLLLRHRPSMRYVHTWNAEVNDHMIAINDAMGYRPLCRDLVLQRKL